MVNRGTRARGSAILLAALLLGASALPAQEAVTHRGVLRELERLRGAAEPLWREGDREGLRLLAQAWALLDQEAVADLVRGSLDLQTRIPNLAFETACARAIVADTAGALNALEEARDAGGRYTAMVRSIEGSCPALHALADLPRFGAIVAAWASDEKRWTSPSIRTPYREELPVAERIAGLSVLWYRVKEYLPSFDVAPHLDWDSLYLAYVPRVLDVRDTYAYYRLLERFVATLGDGHTNVYFPEELAGRRYARPPMLALPVEGRPIVVGVYSAWLEAMGVRRGQEIVAVDGVPVDEYVTEHVAPFQSSSTPQDLGVRAYGYQLLMGDAAHPVRLTLADGGGDTVVVDAPRDGYPDARPRAVTLDTVLGGNIGYLRVDGFDADTLESYLPEALRRLARTAGLIVDVRRNGGGNTRYGYAILATLVDEPVVAARARSRSIVPTYRAWGVQPPAFPLYVGAIRPDSALRYRAPVIVLTGPMTFSAAEDFVMAFDALDLGTIVGEPTGGNTGQPFNFGLPGGGSARVRVKHDSYPDGMEFIGVGIQPDIVIRPTVKGIRAGRDEVLERAVAELRHGGAGRAPGR